MYEPAKPRFVVDTSSRDPQWMEAYRALEDLELSRRLDTTREFSEACALWLRALALARPVFRGMLHWRAVSPADEEALTIRADLLALAAGTSKPTLDAILSGYYWMAFAQLRSLLESARRIGYLRLNPAEAVPHFRLASSSPPEFNKIEAAYATGSNEDQRIFGLINAGFENFRPFAHPSAEGIHQIYVATDPRKLFGPTYSREWADYALKWGIFANAALLREIHLLLPQSPEWVAAVNAILDGCTTWRTAAQAAGQP
jgi:hypothetical protein